MLTKQQAIDILQNPLSYTKKERQEAVKIGIDILDKIAIADGAKEHTDLTINSLARAEKS